jgi:hypothetical protein
LHVEVNSTLQHFLYVVESLGFVYVNNRIIIRSKS